MGIIHEAAAKFNENYRKMMVAGAVHYCSVRTKQAMCDPIKKGIQEVPLADVLCEQCVRAAHLRMRAYARSIGKKYQLGLGIEVEGDKGKEALRR